MTRAREYWLNYVLTCDILLTFVHRFEHYEEGDAAAQYGLPADDTHGTHFPDFEYTAL